MDTDAATCSCHMDPAGAKSLTIPVSMRNKLFVTKVCYIQ